MNIHQRHLPMEAEPAISIHAQIQELKRLRDLVRKAEQSRRKASRKSRKKRARIQGIIGSD